MNVEPIWQPVLLEEKTQSPATESRGRSSLFFNRSVARG